MSRVMVTGLGVICALGHDPQPVWSRLIDGDSGIRAPDDCQICGGHQPVACVDRIPDQHRVVDPRLRRVLNRSFELLAAAASSAACDGNLRARPVPPERLGIVVAPGRIEQCTPDLMELMRHLRESNQASAVLEVLAATGHQLHPLRRLRLLPNIGASLLSIIHRASGPSLSLMGETSGLQAILAAHDLVKSGKADAVLCGGADSWVAPRTQRVLAERLTISAAAPCRPFDRGRNGITPGEGGAILLLESDASSRRRDAAPYAEVIGGGSNGSRGADALAAAIARVWSLAGHSPPDLVVAHGDGGIDSDQDETAALERCFGSSVPLPYVTGTKGSVGHIGAAAGALDALTACLCIKTALVPHIRLLQDPIGGLPFVAGRARRRKSRLVLIHARGSKTGSAALVLRSCQR